MRRLALLALPALMLACTNYHVHYDYDVSQNFAAYKRFDLYAPGKRGKGDGETSSLMDKRIAASVIKELSGKGYVQETSADPDFLVAYYPVYRTRRHRTATHVGFGGWGWHRPWGYGVGTTFSQEHQYREGTLILEIVDFKSNQLVWQAAAEGALTDLDNPEDANEQVARVVRDLLDRFPPKGR
jgi:hypothetical protein